jgi:hypothetical protein
VRPGAALLDLSRLQALCGASAADVSPGAVGVLEAVDPGTGTLTVAGARVHPALVAAAPFQPGDRVRLVAGAAAEEGVVVRVERGGGVVVSDRLAAAGPYRPAALVKLPRLHPWHLDHLRGGLATGTPVVCANLDGPAAPYNGAAGVVVSSAVSARGRQRVRLEATGQEVHLPPQNLAAADGYAREPAHALAQVYTLTEWLCDGRNFSGGCRGPHGGSALGGPLGQARFRCPEPGCDFDLCKDCYEIKSPPLVRCGCRHSLSLCARAIFLGARASSFLLCYSLFSCVGCVSVRSPSGSGTP